MWSAKSQIWGRVLAKCSSATITSVKAKFSLRQALEVKLRPLCCWEVLASVIPSTRGHLSSSGEGVKTGTWLPVVVFPNIIWSLNAARPCARLKEWVTCPKARGKTVLYGQFKAFQR